MDRSSQILSVSRLDLLDGQGFGVVFLELRELFLEALVETGLVNGTVATTPDFVILWDIELLEN